MRARSYSSADEIKRRQLHQGRPDAAHRLDDAKGAAVSIARRHEDVRIAISRWRGALLVVANCHLETGLARRDVARRPLFTRAIGQRSQYVPSPRQRITPGCR